MGPTWGRGQASSQKNRAFGARTLVRVGSDSLGVKDQRSRSQPELCDTVTKGDNDRSQVARS